MNAEVVLRTDWWLVEAAARKNHPSQTRGGRSKRRNLF